MSYAGFCGRGAEPSCARARASGTRFLLENNGPVSQCERMHGRTCAHSHFRRRPGGVCECGRMWRKLGSGRTSRNRPGPDRQSGQCRRRRSYAAGVRAFGLTPRGFGREESAGPPRERERAYRCDSWWPDVAYADTNTHTHSNVRVCVCSPPTVARSCGGRVAGLNCCYVGQLLNNKVYLNWTRTTVCVRECAPGPIRNWWRGRRPMSC